MFGPDDLPLFCRPRCEDAYRRLYNIESYLRFMVRWELVGEFAQDWLQHLGPAKDTAEARRKQEQDVKKIDSEETTLCYLMLAELKDVIISEKVWGLFKEYFSPRDDFQSDLKVLMAVRNKNAHYRPVTDRDLVIVNRYQETLSDLTRVYGQQRANGQALARERLWEPFKGHLTDWAADIASGEGVWSNLTFGQVGKYLRVEAALRSGLLPADTIHRVVRQAKADCFFASLDAASGGLCLYLPKKIGEPQLSKLIGAVRDVEPLSDEIDADVPAERSRLDYVFGAGVRLPVAFKV